MAIVAGVPGGAIFLRGGLWAECGRFGGGLWVMRFTGRVGHMAMRSAADPLYIVTLYHLVKRLYFCIAIEQ